LASYPLQSFNRKLYEAGGSQYLQVVNLTREGSGNGNKDQDKEELLVEMRQIFLELLCEAYNLQLEMGELDTQEDKGFLFETLQASVNLAKNEVEHSSSSIQDWKWTEKFLILENALGGRPAPASGTSDLNEVPTATETIEGQESVTRKAMSAGRIRQDVIRAIAFQQGHKMARTKLALYINRIEFQATSAKSQLFREILEQVQLESLTQAQLATEMMEREIRQEDLVVVMSHYCARILIRRLMKFTERNAQDGMLGKTNARNYLYMMEERIRDIVQVVLDQLDHPQTEQSHSVELELGRVEENGLVNEGGTDSESIEAN
jgi:hypothetical protein